MTLAVIDGEKHTINLWKRVWLESHDQPYLRRLNSSSEFAYISENMITIQGSLLKICNYAFARRYSDISASRFIIQIMNGLRSDRFALNCCELREDVHKKPVAELTCHLFAGYVLKMFSLPICWFYSLPPRPSGLNSTIWHEWHWTNFWDHNPITMSRIVRHLLDVFNVPHWKYSFKKVCQRSVSGLIPFKQLITSQ
jgi:hypothetical protein